MRSIGRGSGSSSVLMSYLDEFDVVAHQLPRDARHDVRARIWRHCADAVGADAVGADPPGSDEERLRAALAELGSPQELVAAELERLGRRPNPFRPTDSAPIHLLAASVLTFGLGALVGLVLLWHSTVWPRRTKITASALVAVGVVALLPVPALPPIAAALLGGLAVGPAVAALYLLAIRLGVRR